MTGRERGTGFLLVVIVTSQAFVIKTNNEYCKSIDGLFHLAFSRACLDKGGVVRPLNNLRHIETRLQYRYNTNPESEKKCSLQAVPSPNPNLNPLTLEFSPSVVDSLTKKVHRSLSRCGSRAII
jgi:hypothetical protein